MNTFVSWVRHSICNVPHVIVRAPHALKQRIPKALSGEELCLQFLQIPWLHLVELAVLNTSKSVSVWVCVRV